MSAATVAEAQAIIHSGQEFDLLFTEIDLNDQREGGVTVGEVLEACRERGAGPLHQWAWPY